jgi:MSHA biogenesis protein MshI
MRPGSYQLLLLKAPDVSETALHSTVRSQVQELVDFRADDAIINVFDMPLQDDGTVKMIYAAVADKSLVQAQIDDIVAANFKLQALEVPEMALARISSLYAEDELGMGLLYFAETHCILNLTLQGQLYISHRIDISLQDLASPDKNERITMIKILLRHIQQAFSYYKKHFDCPAIKYLSIAPLPIYLPYVQQYLSYYLTGVCVQALDLNKLFICKYHLTLEQQAQCLPILGAALRGYKTE